jgi:RNA polymerase subunit RPABC4/transcription elongation factor Spt4
VARANCRLRLVRGARVQASGRDARVAVGVGAAKESGIAMSLVIQHAIGVVVQAVASPTAVATQAAASAPASTGGSGGGVRGLTSLIGLVAAFFAAFVAIFWISLVFWTWRDVRSRTQDVILQITATLLVAIFSLGGLFIYLIVRPRQTLAELYERQLEEESLLAEMTERQTCPTCHYRVENEFQVCPSCGTKLRRPCPRCDHLLELKWNVCPYCGYGGGADGGGRPVRQGARAER